MLAGSLGQRVGEQAGGSASLAQDKDTTAVERCIGVARRVGGAGRGAGGCVIRCSGGYGRGGVARGFLVHRLAGGTLFFRCHARGSLGDGSGSDACGVGLALECGVHGSLLLGGALGDLRLVRGCLFGALLAVVYLEEGEVNEEIDNQQDGDEQERKGLKSQTHGDAQGRGGGPGKAEHEAVHTQDVDEELGDPDIGDGREDEGDEEDGVQDHGSAEEERLVDAKANRHG